MFYFLAQLGKKPVARQIMPMMSFFTGVGYMSYHFYAQNFVCNLYAAEDSIGFREVLSVNMQNLIKKVYEDIRDDLFKPALDHHSFRKECPTIKWFATSLLEPIIVGCADFKNGVLIGLPVFYNYDSIEDIPESAFQLKKLDLFKPKKKSEENNDPSAELKAQIIEEESDESRPSIPIQGFIDSSSSDGKSYAESLILTDNARKFSIAKELFTSDTHKTNFTLCIIVVTGLLSIQLSRAAVILSKSTNKHLLTRLPFYLTSGLIGANNYKFLTGSLDDYYSNSIDKKVIKINDSYKQGAVEYYTKIMQRNRALKNLFEDFKFRFDDQGNLANRSLLPNFRYTYQQKLELLQQSSDET